LLEKRVKYEKNYGYQVEDQRKQFERFQGINKHMLNSCDRHKPQNHLHKRDAKTGDPLSQICSLEPILDTVDEHLNHWQFFCGVAHLNEQAEEKPS